MRDGIRVTLSMVVLFLLAVTGCGGANSPDSAADETPPNQETPRNQQTPASQETAANPETPAGASVAPPATPPGSVTRAPENSAGRLFRGSILVGSGAPSLRPCGTQDPLVLTDPSGEIERLQAELATDLPADTALFAVVEGRAATAQTAGDDPVGSLQIETVLYFGFEGPGCESGWDFAYRARGNEPFWMVQAADNGLELRRPAEADLLWPEFLIVERAGGPTYRAVATEDLPAAALTIQAEPCRDSMSGAYFAYSATFAFGDQSFSGCALVGSR